MIETLADIQIATNLLKQVGEGEFNENPLDTYYRSLNTGISVLDHKSDEWSLIQQYIQKTHAPTHTNYSLEMLEVYALDRPHDPYVNKYGKLNNKMLLWHGSRLSNWVGILSQGLRIAPPEAPVTGYMYVAEIQYCIEM
jgi:hypothetical protein